MRESLRSGIESTLAAVALLDGASTWMACSFHPRGKAPETSDDELAKRRADRMKIFISPDSLQMIITAFVDES